MRAALSLLLAALLALPASAQTRGFNCIGAEALEDEVFAVPFLPGSAQVTDAARSSLAAAAGRLSAEPASTACVLGHADREGAQAANVRLAAGRARAVVQALSTRHGIERGRLRAEARVAGFSRRTGNPAERSVSIVVLPPRPALAVPPSRPGIGAAHAPAMPTDPRDPSTDIPTPARP